ncbi:MAG: single-stranded-DNA-specific exonuclease RecJ [Thermomicrobiales bacterium]
MALQWIEPSPTPPAFLAAHPDPVVAAILARRLGSPGEIVDFLDSKERPAPDPFLLPNLEAAISRIRRALAQGEAIGIFGDYDTDGVTSTAILTIALRAASGGAQPVAVRLPFRHEGYGFSVAGVNDLAAEGARLIIAVDCGSKDHEAVAHARARGIDIIIIDHHRLIEDPPGDAIVVTPQLDPESPYTGMAAAGLAYLVAVALAQAGLDAGDGPGALPRSLLDLAMIGVVGDVSPLLGVNRALVRDGLRVLRKGPQRPGLVTLANSAGFDLFAVNSRDIAFRVSPRLNAPGRFDDPRPSYELLMAQSMDEALRSLGKIEQMNAERKVAVERLHADIAAMLAQEPDRLDRRFLMLASPDWKKGIVGLASSRLVEEHDRPVAVLSIDGKEAHGSVRSVPGFDVAAALSEHSHLLLRHGGHARAAGFSVALDRLAELEDVMHAAVIAAGTPPPGPGRLEIDADLPAERLTVETVRQLACLGPFGEGNPEPVLRVPGAALEKYLTMGAMNNHLKLQVRTGRGTVDAILWNGAHRSRELVGRRRVDLAGELERNVWNGRERVQMRLRDFRVAE